MKKDLAIIFGLFLLVALLIIFGQGFTTAGFLTNKSAGGSLFNQPTNKIAAVMIKSLDVKATVADTAASRKKGLSKKTSIPLNEGMLFVFENPGDYGIWMKDMKLAIDIIWLDEGKKIIGIAKNVPPEHGKKENQLIVYKSGGIAKYVLEINAGLSALNNLQNGDIANFIL